jgi:hypothetical protein
MVLPFDYIGYKRLSENKRFPNHRWYSDATLGENGWMVSIVKQLEKEKHSNFNVKNCVVMLIYWDTIIYTYWLEWGNSKFVVPEMLTIDRGEAEVNSQGRGDKKLDIAEYTVYKYCIIPKNIRLIVEWSPLNVKDQ